MKKYVLICAMVSLSILCMQEPKWDGDEYNQNSRPQFDLALKYISSLNIQPHEHILDIGCGSGKITLELASLVPHGLVVGIDKSASMIAASKAETHADNLSFEIMDAESITFNEQFDRIFSANTFHWIKNKEAAFFGCSSALKKGGLLNIIMGGDTEYKQPAILAFYKLVAQGKWSEKLKGAEIEQYLFSLNEKMARELLEKADLEVKDIRLLQNDMVLPSAENFKSFIGVIAKGAYPFFSSLEEIEQQEFLDEFLYEYLTLVPAGEGGSVRYPVYSLMIFACKK